MTCEELTGIFCADKQEGEVQLRLRKKQEGVGVPAWPSAMLDHVSTETKNLSFPSLYC